MKISAIHIVFNSLNFFHADIAGELMWGGHGKDSGFRADCNFIALRSEWFGCDDRCQLQHS